MIRFLALHLLLNSLSFINFECEVSASQTPKPTKIVNRLVPLKILISPVLKLKNQLITQDPMTKKHRLGYRCLVEAGYVDLTDSSRTDAAVRECISRD